jgi:hypothetical protein
MSWLAEGLQHSESANAGIGPDIRKVSSEKSGSGIPRQFKPLGITNNYVMISWRLGPHRKWKCWIRT